MPSTTKEDGEIIPQETKYNPHTIEKDHHKKSSRSSSPDRPYRSQRHHSSDRDRYRSSQSRSQSRSRSRSRHRHDDDRDRAGAYKHSSRDDDRSYHHHNNNNDTHRTYDHRDRRDHHSNRYDTSYRGSPPPRRYDDTSYRGYEKRPYNPPPSSTHRQDRHYRHHRHRHEDEGRDDGLRSSGDDRHHTHSTNKIPRPMVRAVVGHVGGDVKKREERPAAVEAETAPPSPCVDRYIQCIAAVLGEEYSNESGFRKPYDIHNALVIVEQSFRNDQSDIWDRQDQERRLLLMKLGLLCSEDAEPFTAIEFTRLPAEYQSLVDSMGQPGESLVAQSPLPFDPVDGSAPCDPRRKYAEEYKAMAAWAARPLPLTEISVTMDREADTMAQAHEDMDAVVGSPPMELQQQQQNHESPQRSGSWATSPQRGRPPADNLYPEEWQRPHDAERHHTQESKEKQHRSKEAHDASSSAATTEKDTALDAPSAPRHEKSMSTTGKPHASPSGLLGADELPLQERDKITQLVDIDEGYFEVTLCNGRRKIEGQYASLVQKMKEGEIPRNWPAYRPMDGLWVPMQEGLTLDDLVWPIAGYVQRIKKESGDAESTKIESPWLESLRQHERGGKETNDRDPSCMDTLHAWIHTEVSDLTLQKTGDAPAATAIRMKDGVAHQNNNNNSTREEKAGDVGAGKKRPLDALQTTDAVTDRSVHQHNCSVKKKQRLLAEEDILLVQHRDVSWLKSDIAATAASNTSNGLYRAQCSVARELESKNKAMAWGGPVPPHLIAAIQGYILGKQNILQTFAIGSLQKAVREYALKEKGGAPGGVKGIIGAPQRSFVPGSGGGRASSAGKYVSKGELSQKKNCD